MTILLHPEKLNNQLESFLLACDVEGKAKATLLYYKYQVGRFVGFCADAGVDQAADVTRQTVRLFLLQLKQTNAPQSVHDYYRAIRRFFNWLKGEHIIEASPMEGMTAPHVPEALIKPLELSDIEGMYQLESYTPMLTARNRAIVLTLLDTGLREREMSDSDIADINVDQRTINVMGKNGKEAVVNVTKKTLKAIIEYLKLRTDDDPCLWIGLYGKRFAPQGFYALVKRLGVRAGVDVSKVRCSPHTFRHTCGTELMKNGASAFEVQTILRHETPMMTRHYTRSLDSRSEVIKERHRQSNPVDRLKL